MTDTLFDPLRRAWRAPRTDTVLKMGRNYSLPTIKTLFGEASRCAYPDCDGELIFRDRDVTTVVAQIAHIRSERPGGPRHDPTYPGDVDGPDNLLLLCGKHHAAVDRHESIYTIEELEEWKANQRAGAQGGTEITDSQARLFARLSPDETQALAQVARLSQRVTSAARDTQNAINAVEAGRRAARQAMQQQIGPVYEVDDAGHRRSIGGSIELPRVENDRWDEEVRNVLAAHRPTMLEAVNQLREEVAVIQMMSGEGLAARAEQVALVADGLPLHVGNEANLDLSAVALKTAMARLWSTAQGTDDDSDPPSSSTTRY